MFGKLAALIVAVGIVACLLLAARHQRLRAVGELARVQARYAEHQRTLHRLRVEIASRTMPERVRQLAARLGPLEALRPGLPQVLVPRFEYVADRAATPVRLPSSPSQPSPPGAPR